MVLGANGYRAQDGCGESPYAGSGCASDGPSLKCKAISPVTKIRSSSWHVRYACTGDASLTEEVRLHLDEKTGQLIMNSKVKMK
jgi:hypothetical protein